MKDKTIEALLIELYDNKVISAAQYHLMTEAVKQKVRDVRKKLEYLQPDNEYTDLIKILNTKPPLQK